MPRETKNRGARITKELDRYITNLSASKEFTQGLETLALDHARHLAPLHLKNIAMAAINSYENKDKNERKT